VRNLVAPRSKAISDRAELTALNRYVCCVRPSRRPIQYPSRIVRSCQVDFLQEGKAYYHPGVPYRSFSPSLSPPVLDPHSLGSDPISSSFAWSLQSRTLFQQRDRLDHSYCTQRLNCIQSSPLPPGIHTSNSLRPYSFLLPLPE